MAIGPLTPVPAIPGARPVEPVTEPAAVRAVIGRLAALAQASLGADKAQAPLTLEAALARAVAEAVQSAAPRQGGLGPLMADLAQALGSPALPAPAREAAARLLGLQTPLTPAIEGADVKQAAARSGLFLEARLAGQPPAAAALAPDLKAALIAAREVFTAWAEATEAEVPPPQAAPAPAPSRPSAPQTPPPPPFRNGPVDAQAPAAPPPPAEPRALARRLLRETEAAVARQELMQAASLPNARAADPAEPPGRTHWLFEVPFATPQGTAVAQFEVERDGGGGGDPAGPGETAPAWRARFALDVEPFGPVHVQVTLSGARAGVQLWAERSETAERLRAAQGLLRADLEAADYAPEVAVSAGAPSRPAAAPGLFVDRSS